MNELHCTCMLLATVYREALVLINDFAKRCMLNPDGMASYGPLF